ncbi:tRNA dihydrouridine synthase [Pseudoteredinibacter isoporae]|uniref:tRNA dihydrouridine synthase n=1 Tax=Pseudoteredinibacter isoporae TaxID=570281 RepID=UPI003108C94A
MRIFLAPMEGVVDFQMRQLLTSIGGLDGCVTEFLRIGEQRLPRRVFTKLCPELLQQSRTPSGTPVAFQLLGGNAEAMAFNAAKAAGLGADSIDLNFGCPAKTVNRNDGGAKLLQEPKRIHRIVKAVRDAVPSGIDVTAKIRLGFQDRSMGLENAHAIADAGAQQLVVHARSKNDAYRPPAYWDELRPIRDQLNIPVIANGEIWSPDDLQRCADHSGCEDFMIGRGLLARPDLALAIRNPDAHQAWCWEDILPLLLDFFRKGIEQYPEKYCGNRLKQWFMYLQRNYPEAELFFNQLKRLRKRDEIEMLFAHHAKEQKIELAS